jgi:hypothetical protein
MYTKVKLTKATEAHFTVLWFDYLQYEVKLNIIQKLISYLIQNSVRLHYKDQPVNDV